MQSVGADNVVSHLVSDCTELQANSYMWKNIVSLVNNQNMLDKNKCVSVVTVDECGCTKRYWVRGSRVFQDTAAADVVANQANTK